MYEQSAGEFQDEITQLSQPQSITQKGVHAHPLTAREREHWFLQHLSHFIAVNFGRQSCEHPFVRYFGALPTTTIRLHRFHISAVGTCIHKRVALPISPGVASKGWWKRHFVDCQWQSRFFRIMPLFCLEEWILLKTGRKVILLAQHRQMPMCWFSSWRLTLNHRARAENRGSFCRPYCRSSCGCDFCSEIREGLAHSRCGPLLTQGCGATVQVTNSHPAPTFASQKYQARKTNPNLNF